MVNSCCDPQVDVLSKWTFEAPRSVCLQSTSGTPMFISLVCLLVEQHVRSLARVLPRLAAGNRRQILLLASEPICRHYAVIVSHPRTCPNLSTIPNKSYPLAPPAMPTQVQARTQQLGIHTGCGGVSSNTFADVGLSTTLLPATRLPSSPQYCSEPSSGTLTVGPPRPRWLTRMRALL